MIAPDFKNINFYRSYIEIDTDININIDFVFISLCCGF